MKRVLTLILAAILLLTFAACAKEDSDPNLIEIGDYQALYTGAWITKDYDGDDAIVIPMTFTNNSDEAASFMWSMFYTALQGDAELEIATIFVSEDSFDTLSESMMDEVPAGESLEVNLTYKLNNLTEPVVIGFSDLFDKDTDELTVEVAELETKNPDAGNAGDSGSDSTEGSGTVAADGTAAIFDEYEVVFVEGEITLDSEGRFTLVLAYDYTNKDSGENAYGWSVYDTGYQNGEELDTTDIYLDDGTMLRDTHYEEVPEGETLRVYETYLINDTLAPVEIQFTDLFETKVETITVDLTTLPNNAGGATADGAGVGYAFDPDFAELYAGDWHGMAEFYDCVGDYADEDGMECEIIARFVFDENGYCTPYIRLCLSQSENENFVIDSMEYDEEYDCMLINGCLSEMPLDPIESFVEADGTGAIYIGAIYDGGSDVFKVLGCLRRLDDEWDYENDYPYLPEAGVEFYAGMTMEEIVDLYGYDVSLLPALTDGPATESPEEPEEALPFETGIPSGDGMVDSLQVLIDLKNWLNEQNSYENDYYKPTVEEFIAQAGVNPAPSNLKDWREDYVCYVWRFEGPEGKDSVTLTLQPAEDGSGWIYKALSWSNRVAAG